MSKSSSRQRIDLSFDEVMEKIINDKDLAADLIKSGYVDEVIEIEDSPLEVIMMIQPNIIAVGGDYSKETTVGYPECLEWKGEVKIIERLPNLSTTEIMQSRENNELIACFTGKLGLKQRG